LYFDVISSSTTIIKVLKGWLITKLLIKYIVIGTFLQFMCLEVHLNWFQRLNKSVMTLITYFWTLITTIITRREEKKREKLTRVSLKWFV
jgi:hypothetical protein